MATDDQILIDTRDMVAIHRTFTRAFSEAPAQIASVREGDVERARTIADYLGEVLWLLHAHHVGEDELLYPLLIERVPESAALFAEMDAQHSAVSSGLEAAEQAAKQFGTSGSTADGRALAAAIAVVLEVTIPHLDDEEAQVLAIAARVITPPEWGALPAHALGSYRGERVWLPFGLALEAMPDDLREALMGKLPPPVTGMWFGGGADAFANEMRVVRGDG